MISEIISLLLLFIAPSLTWSSAAANFKETMKIPYLRYDHQVFITYRCLAIQSFQIIFSKSSDPELERLCKEGGERNGLKIDAEFDNYLGKVSKESIDKGEAVQIYFPFFKILLNFWLM
jgi:hypothetical protein